MILREERPKKDLVNEIVAEQERNRIFVTCMCIMNVLLAIAYFIEVIKGLRGLGEYIIVFLLTIIPSIIGWIAYSKKKEGKNIRYIMSISFIALYIYVMLTADTMMVFCYILLMMTLLTVYGDSRLAVVSGVSALVINIASVVKMAMTNGLTASDTTDIEVSIACLLFMTMYTVMTSGLIDKINSSRMKNLNTEKQQTSELLKTVLGVADAMEQNIEVLREETQKLDISVGNTKESMAELAEGEHSTAEAILTQQTKTDEIQKYIETLSDVTNRIVAHIDDSEEVVVESQTTMNQLMNQVESSENVSNRVAEQMEGLKTYTAQMQSIMELIINVASQTELLALNASIEAARAGEAGRGFAIVATEISNLANQTSDATGNINVLIDGIGHSLEEVVKAVESMLESNQIQAGYIGSTAEKFEQIHKSIGDIFEESGTLNEIVNTVAEANAAIVESIQNVSVRMQEISAKAMETLQASNEDKESVEKVRSTVEQLEKHAEELNKNR